LEEASLLSDERPDTVVRERRLDREVYLELDRSAELLVQADREIALVARALPVPARVAAGRALRGAGAVAARAASVDLSATRRLLVRMARTTAPFGELGRLHAERALELELEARIVEAFGTPSLHTLAAERFPPPRGASARACESFAADALSLPVVTPEHTHRSDDVSDPKSLLSVLSRRARELGVPLRIDVRKAQLATAATGDGIVAVRAGVMLSADAAERIAVHELLGHALPRLRARHAPFRIFRAGTRGAADHEEGRALLIETRSGLLDAGRRRELALRHRAALAVRDRAAPSETAALLVELGAERAFAEDITRRAHRGGGLGREIVYLPAYFEVRRALAEEPGLERWLERGRLDLGAARLFAHGVIATER
jgi:hypothetical protein